MKLIVVLAVLSVILESIDGLPATSDVEKEVERELEDASAHDVEKRAVSPG